jgi:hypothetical protein
MTIDKSTIAIGALLAYQVFISVRILLSDSYSNGQKAAQLVLTWVVPLLGAFFCHLFLRADAAKPPKRDTSFVADHGGNPPGIGGG